MRIQTVIDDIKIEFDAQQTTDGLKLRSGNIDIDFDCFQLSDNSFSLILNGKSHFLSITENDDGLETTVDQHTNIVRVKDETQLLLEKYGFSNVSRANAGEIRALIPGLVSKLFIQSGDKIKKGQKLLILEAMKMENEILAPVSGTIQTIYCKQGDTVEKGNFIMKVNVDN